MTVATYLEGLYTSPVALLSLAVSAALIGKAATMGRREKGLPPGPPTTPVLGNLLDFPTLLLENKFTKWARQFGDVFSLKIASSNIVVVTSPKALREVFETNNAHTADRPAHTLTEQLTGGVHIVFIRQGPTWKILRRTAYEMLSPAAVAQTLPIQVAESTQLMFDLLRDPDDHYNHYSRYALSVIMSVVHGQRCPRYASETAQILIKNLKTFSQLVRPGETPPLDLIPILKYVPERWASWKTTLKDLRHRQREYYIGLMEQTKARMIRGEGNGCFMQKIMENQEEYKLTDEMVIYMGASMLEAGSDTSASYLQSAMQILIEHPEVQKKAQEELDRVVGSDRMPNEHDWNKLPYCNAIIEEVHRIRPVVATGVPHCTSGDVKHGDYTIPKDTILFANIWGVGHDESLFDKPEVFNPERYLQNPYGLRRELGASAKEYGILQDMDFGFGRRKCPGIHIAKNSMILNVSRLLWGFDVLHAKNLDGTPIKMDFDDVQPTVTTTPNPYKCVIRPRSPRHAEVIRREWLEATDAFSPFEHELDAEDKVFLRSVRGD